MEKISVIVQTYNAQRHLDIVLKSLARFDEIVVADMESTDGTVAIARRHGAKVVVYPRGEHRICEAFRDRAVHEAANPWVLVVDADEVVTSALREYLYDEIARDPSPRGIMIPRRNYFRGRWMWCDYPDYVCRFFKRDGSFWPIAIHSLPTYQGPTVKIDARRTDLALIHLANEPLSRQIEKMNQYTSMEKQRRRVGYRRYKLLTDPAFRFFKSYIMKGAYRQGVDGFIRAVMDGFYRFSALAKIEEERCHDGLTDLDNDLINAGYESGK